MHTSRVKRTKTRLQAGFSVLELSLVLLVMGVLMATSLRVYTAYQNKQRVLQTTEALETVTNALTRYFATYSRFPCPASLSVGPESSAFGQMTNCDDETVPPGMCNGHYCVGSRMVDHDGDPGTPDIELRVRTGSVPFKQLQEGIIDGVTGAALYDDPFTISSRDTADAYGNRFTYVVTEQQASRDYVVRLGGILVQDEFGRVMGENRDYVLVSHGVDGVGGYTYNGDLVAPCSASAGRDAENCDMDTVFTDALHARNPGSNYFDDTIIYRSWLHYFLWDTADDNVENIFNLNTGNVGIGTTQPEQRFHVLDGNVLSTGDLYTMNMCEEDGSDCFAADLIGGTAFPACPDGQAMEGIAFSAPLCTAIFSGSSNQSCPAGWYIYGFQYDSGARTLVGLCRPPP